MSGVGGKTRTSGQGRKKGVPNKTTTDVRLAIAMIAERNVEKLEQWLAEVATTDPGKASDIFLRMIEYHIPKQSRSEVTGPNGGPIDTAWTVKIVHVDKK